MGQPSVFLRLSLCNVNCPMCDTDYHQGVKVSLSDIVKAITGPYARGGIRHLVITGGEPYIHPALSEFLATMRELHRDWHITIETSGSIVPGTVLNLDLLSLSPKFMSLKPAENSHMGLNILKESFLRILELPRKENSCQVKLVWTGDPVDVPDWLPDMISDLAQNSIPVFFQPMTDGREFELNSYLKLFAKVTAAVQNTFGAYPRTLPQLHKFCNWR